MRLLVSACLLGVCCRYDGQAKPDERVLSLLKNTKKEKCVKRLKINKNKNWRK